MMKVMIIDDDSDSATLRALWLRRAGLDVSLHSSPFGSVNAIRKGNFDLVILDLVMPGLDGQELVRLIRDTRGLEQTKLFLCSGMLEDELRAIATAVGVRAFVSKASSKNEFVGAVMSALGS